MTTNAFSPAPRYTISGIGPYDVPYAYGATDELKVATVTNGVSQPLDAADFSVVPEGPATSGTVFLTADAAAAHDGEALEITRDTEVVQLWQGLASTATSLEDQLDQMTRALQDTQTEAATSLRVSGTWRTSVAELVADNLLTYEAGKINTADAGARITTLAEGFTYEVAESSATDHHLETAGGVKLYVLPVNGEAYHLAAFNIANDGVTDDFAKFRQAADACRDNGIASLILPGGDIFCGQELEFDWYGGIYGVRGHADSAGNGTTRLYFPAGTNGIRFCRPTTSTSGGRGDDSILQDVQIECKGDNANSTGHGVVMDARGVCVRVSVHGFPENGFHIEASATDTPAKNANCWTLERCRSNSNGRDGFFVDGADANAGEAIGCDANTNGRVNFFDSSFLGNTWISAHSAFPAMRSLGFGSDGKVYRCILDHVSTADTLPVTGADWETCWELWDETFSYVYQPIEEGVKYYDSRAGHGGQFPLYHYLSDNVNAQSVFINCYSEGADGAAHGGSRINSGSTILSKIIGELEFDWVPIFPGRLPLNATSRAESGAYVESALGATSNGMLTALGWQASSSSLYWRLAFDDDNKVWRLDGNNSAFVRTFSIYDQDNTWNMPRGLLDFGYMGFAVAAKRHTASPGEPTSGSYATGDIIYNTNPVPGGHVGWVCTTGGTAGSTAVFKPFGGIES